MKYSLTIILLLAFSQINAQTAIGVKVGVQNSKLTTDWEFYEGYDFKSIYTPNIGVLFNFGYKNAVSFQMELNYNKKGLRIDDEIEMGEELTNIELPLLLKISTKGKDIRYYGVFGPFVSMAHTVTFRVDDSIEKWNYIGLENLDVGFQVGGGIDYKLGLGSLIADIRFAKGFGETIFNTSYDSRAINLSVGYLICLGRK